MTARHLELVYFDAGGGHRAATEALRQVLAERYPDWTIDIVNLQEVLKSADPLFILTGVPSQNFYNAALKLGLTYGSRGFLRGMQAAIKLCASRMEEILRQRWDAANGKQLDAVVSVIPNFNGVMFRALRAARPQVPYITIMTDMADTPPHFWQENQDQHLICGTSFAARQAQATGWYRPERIYQTSGMILRPSFYTVPKKARLTRAQLGLADGIPTAMIMFGGYGSSLAADIVNKLAKDGKPIQTIVMCGHNEELRAALQSKPGCHAAGYAENIADYMRCADFLIGKPGPGSLSEAWHMGLPVIAESNARTMIQERPNIQIMEKLGAGIAVKNFRSIAAVIRKLTESEQLETLRANIRKLDNQAVFEIPVLLDRIMAQPAPGSRPTGLTAPRRLTRLAKKWRRKSKKRPI